MSLPVLGLIIALIIGIFVGYDAERWDRSINGWSLAGTVLNVPGLAVWLMVRHGEARRRLDAGEALPPGFFRWLRLRRHARPGRGRRGPDPDGEPSD
jgi:ABC-type dipeptide/oligopeptide/nickel transport system permease subunit